MNKQNKQAQTREEFLKEKVRKNFPPLLVKAQTNLELLMRGRELAQIRLEQVEEAIIFYDYQIKILQEQEKEA